MNIREDAQTVPIEINVQSAGISRRNKSPTQTMMMGQKNSIGRGKKQSGKPRYRRPRCNNTHIVYKFVQTTTRNTSLTTEDGPDIYRAIQSYSTTTIQGKNPS